MQGVEYNDPKELTLLELVLQLHGEFRRTLEPIRVTPLQAGVLLFLRRHAEANMTKAATVLRVRLPTLSEVVKDLVRKGWVTKRRSVTDTRVVHLRLSRLGGGSHQEDREPSSTNEYGGRGVQGSDRRWPEVATISRSNLRLSWARSSLFY